MEKTRLWTRDFIINMLINFFAAMNFYLLMVIIYDFAVESIKASSGAAGIASGIFVIGGLTARVLLGNSLERIGYKRTLFIGSALSLVATLMYFAASSVPLLLIIRFFHGFSFGITTTATITIVARLVPPDRSGEGIGFFGLSQTLATAIGPFVAIALSRYESYNVIFMVCASASAVSLISVPFIKLDGITSDTASLKNKTGFESPIERKVIPASLIVLFSYICYSNVVSYLDTYSQELGLTRAASFFFLVYAGAVFLSRPTAGRAFDRRGANTVIYSTLAICTIGILLLAFSFSGLLLLLSAAVLGIGIGGIQSGTQTLCVKLSPPDRIGRSNSTYMIFGDIGMGIGPSIAGTILPYTGCRGLYVLLTVVCALTLFFYFILYGRKAHEVI